MLENCTITAAVIGLLTPEKTAEVRQKIKDSVDDLFKKEARMTRFKAEKYHGGCWDPGPERQDGLARYPGLYRTRVADES